MPVGVAVVALGAEVAVGFGVAVGVGLGVAAGAGGGTGAGGGAGWGWSRRVHPGLGAGQLVRSESLGEEELRPGGPAGPLGQAHRLGRRIDLLDVGNGDLGGGGGRCALGGASRAERDDARADDECEPGGRAQADGAPRQRAPRKGHRHRGPAMASGRPRGALTGQVE